MIDELLREARPEVAPPDPVVTVRARRALLRKALARRTHRRYAVRAAIGLGAAATIVAATVVAQSPDHGASAAAATILERSAARLDAARPPLPGQYLYRKNVTLSWDFGPSPSDPQKEDTQPRTSPVTVETWVPTDPAKEVIQRTIDPDSKISWAVVSQSTNDSYPIYRAQPHGTAMLDAMRDLVRRGGSGTSDDVANLWTAAFWLLSDPQTPDDIAAEVLRAIATVEGVRVVDRSADIEGKVGVALGIDSEHALDFVFDQADGAFLGIRTHPARTKSWVGPDEPVQTLSFESRVVDSAPRPPARLLADAEK
jgi:hypothetical protein